MFSFFSHNKNSKALEEEKIEQKHMEIPKIPAMLSVNDAPLHFDRIKKSEIEKEILLKRRRDSNISLENIETSYKKRLISKKFLDFIRFNEVF